MCVCACVCVYTYPQQGGFKTDEIPLHEITSVKRGGECHTAYSTYSIVVILVVIMSPRINNLTSIVVILVVIMSGASNVAVNATLPTPPPLKETY